MGMYRDACNRRQRADDRPMKREHAHLQKRGRAYIYTNYTMHVMRVLAVGL